MSRRILLWCDEETTVRTLQSVLAELGVGVERCASTEEAGLLLQQQRFDAVIIDLDESGSDAHEILRRARNSALNRNTLTLAVVGSTVKVQDVFALGVNFLLYKPISKDRARASLRAAYLLMGRERRRNVRLPVHAKATVEYVNVENGEATLVDLSESGTAIQSERKVPPSCKVYFKFELPEQASVVRLSAEVVWQDSAGRVGLRFVDLPQRSRRLLREWLEGAFEKAQQKARTSPPTGNAAPPAAQLKSGPGHADDGLARFRAAPGNRRSQSRRPCQIGASVYKVDSDVPHRCTLSDISTGGCYVEMPSPFSVGDRIEVQVRTRDCKLRVPGVVLASHPGYGMGVRFELRNPSDREGLERLIALLGITAPGLEYGTATVPPKY
jgi:CheY-like chemotaxis protein